MSRQSISFTEPNAAWLKQKVDVEGEYRSNSDATNDAIRRMREAEAEELGVVSAGRSVPILQRFPPLETVDKTCAVRARDELSQERYQQMADIQAAERAKQTDVTAFKPRPLGGWMTP